MPERFESCIQTRYNTLRVGTFLLQLLDYREQISHWVSLGQGS
jgi:hypothetical protein